MQTFSSSHRYDLDWKYVTSGWRGKISRVAIDGNLYCLKQALSPTFTLNITREIFVLEKIKHLGLVGYTEILDYGDDWFVAKWIESVDFDVAWGKNLFPKKTLVLGLLERAYILDSHEIEHGELHRPMSNVLVDRQGKVHIIDFDQGGFGNTKNKNIRHVIQWMLSQQILSLQDIQVLRAFQGSALYENLLQLVEKRVEGFSCEKTIS